MWKLKLLCFENVSLTISSLFGRGGMRLIFSVLFASVLVAPVAHAQDSNGDENELEEIVVTATRIPTPLADTLPSTAIITAEDIERIKPQDFGELLKLKSGIGFRDSGGRGSQGSLFVRGTSNKHVLILINGMRTSSATLGATAIENIPLDSIERIEIIKGPMSGVYGSDAVGGVIQIFTKQNDEEGSFATVNSTFGSNNLQKYSGRAGYGNSGYSVSASLSTESTDGIDRTENKENGNEDVDGYEQNSGDFSLTAILEDSAILKFNHLKNSSRNEYDNAFGGPGKGLYLRGRLETTSLNLEYEHSDAFNIVGKVGTAKDFSTRFLNSSRLSYINTRKTDYSVQGDLILNPQIQFSIGVDYQTDRVSSSQEYDKIERTNKGFFGLWQYQGDRSSTVLNARYDKNSDYGSISNYTLQQSFDVSEKSRIIASYGTAFKAPTFNDLYWPLEKSEWNGITYITEGNPDVKPEESKSFELSFRVDFDETLLQINAYQTKITNLIDWKTDDISPSVKRTTPANVIDATLEGIEIEITRKWDDYVFRTNLDYLDAKDDNAGEFLEDRARASGSIELGKQIDNFYVGVDAFFEHARFDRGNFLPGYALWGLHANYEISDSLSISGKVDNLFDKEYVTNVASGGNDYQNEGRTVQISVEYKF